jgi:hypothetical protein
LTDDINIKEYQPKTIFNTSIILTGIGTIASLVSQNYAVGLLGGFTVITEGILCHLMGQVIYGMEQRIFE